MFARTTTVIARQPGIDRGIQYVKDVVMPALQGIPGFVGLSTLVDRATGRCIITSSWQSTDSLRISEGQVRGIRDRCAASFDATETSVDQWEVAVMHRARPTEEPAGASVSWLEGDPATMGALVDAYRAALPRLEQLPGFTSTSLLVDRRSGRAVSTVVYDAAAMAKARPHESAIRTAIADIAGAYVIEVAEFELAISQLRIPELV
jgi:heme-degrading monooxygenase HmoA